MKIRIMSVMQPWAWAICRAGKNVENRSRNIAGDYRGPVLIHAGQKFDEEGAEVCAELAGLDYKHDPRSAFPKVATSAGGIVGIAQLDDVILTRAQEREWKAKSKWYAGGIGLVLSHQKPLPFAPLRGQLGLWTIETDLLPPETRNAIEDWLKNLTTEGKTMNETKQLDPNDEALVEQAIAHIKKTKRATAASVQRALRIGYTRAALILDILEERGVVGPAHGADPREILIAVDPAPVDEETEAEEQGEGATSPDEAEPATAPGNDAPKTRETTSEKELECVLLDGERAERGREMADLFHLIERTRAANNAKIKALKEELKASLQVLVTDHEVLADVVSSGREKRMVKVRRVVDVDAGRVREYRMDTEELLSDEPLKGGDYEQPNLRVLPKPEDGNADVAASAEVEAAQPAEAGTANEPAGQASTGSGQADVPAPVSKNELDEATLRTLTASALEVLVQVKRASESTLARRLRLTRSKALEVMNELKRRGVIVDPAKPGEPHQIVLGEAEMLALQDELSRVPSSPSATPGQAESTPEPQAEEPKDS